MIYKVMNKKWFLLIIYSIIVIISDHIYLNYINKGCALNFPFLIRMLVILFPFSIGMLIIFWTKYYLIYKTVKKLKKLKHPTTLHCQKTSPDAKPASFSCSFGNAFSLCVILDQQCVKT